MKPFPAAGLVLGGIVLAAASPLLMLSDAVRGVLLAGWLLLAALALRDYLWLRRTAPRISIVVEAPASAIRGDDLDVHLAIDNRAPRPLTLWVRALLPGQAEPSDRPLHVLLPKQGTARLPLSLHTRERGTHRFGDIFVRARAPGRMLHGQWRIPHASQCRVYPDIRSVKEYIIARRMHSPFTPHMRTTRMRGIGSEFESLRDYEQGDDIRRIDWRATARHNKLIMREYEIEHERNVLVVIDGGRLMAGAVNEGTKLDHAIDAALMIGGVALDGGDRFGVLFFTSEVQAYLPPKGGMAQLARVTEALYDIRPTLVESNFRRAFTHLQTRLIKRSLVLVISDVIDAETSASLVTGMLALSQRHLVVLAALRAPEVEAVLAAPGPTDDAPFRKAVAYRLIEARAEAMAKLQKGGVHVLDVHPQRLTVPLVNKYIELREMNLL